MMARRMSELAHDYAMPQPDLIRRALNQAARELMLAQSSDWAFIMKAGTCVDYAVGRTKSHISRFNRLYNDIRSSDVDHEWVADLESIDNIFPDMDYMIYSASPMASAILDT
jgi:1,4-alpha-glucan branching enzyme